VHQTERLTALWIVDSDESARRALAWAVRGLVGHVREARSSAEAFRGLVSLRPFDFLVEAEIADVPDWSFVALGKHSDEGGKWVVLLAYRAEEVRETAQRLVIGRVS